MTAAAVGAPAKEALNVAHPRPPLQASGQGPGRRSQGDFVPGTLCLAARVGWVPIARNAPWNRSIAMRRDSTGAPLLPRPAMPDLPPLPPRGSREVLFATTRWSVVVSAGREDSRVARAALEELCGAYWYPLYVFVRRTGRSAHDAQDLVQGFFAALLEKHYLREVDREKGRFRSFLLLALKRFLANEWDKERARKRGGDRVLVSLDALTAEQRYALEPAESRTADQLFERRWATTLLERVLTRLRDEQVASGRAVLFEQLKEFLVSPGRGTPYAELAARLGSSEGAVKVAVHRFRRRYRDLLEEEIARTVNSPGEVDEERRHLLSALAL